MELRQINNAMIKSSRLKHTKNHSVQHKIKTHTKIHSAYTQNHKHTHTLSHSTVEIGKCLFDSNKFDSDKNTMDKSKNTTFSRVGYRLLGQGIFVP